MAREDSIPLLPDADMGSDASAVTRRSFLSRGTAVIAGIAATGGETKSARGQSGQRSVSPSSFLELQRMPDSVTAYGRFEGTLPTDRWSLDRKASEWSGGAAGRPVVVDTRANGQDLVFTLFAPSTPVVAVHARWSVPVAARLSVLGDAWERSYGELGWRDVIPERVMPWYFATYDDAACHGYGVKTDAAALCFWQLDQQGVSLWMNVANGGSGVELGSRRLTMATVISRRGSNGESSMDAVTGLCRQMCARTSRPQVPIYGANDWNYSYGRSTAQSILHDTEFIVELSPTGAVRPFSVIDGGWTNGTPAWPDMGKLAQEISRRGARPGIWIRPLEAPRDSQPGLVLPGARFGEKQDRARASAWDPTVPEAQEQILTKIKQVKGWGYGMIKHDFSTYDLLGQWGFEMGPQPTLSGWSLHDRTRTNAEVISALYAMLRQEAGSAMLLDGCNTVGHLGQGIFDLQRTGDDTSGRQWERTRRMGLNTLSFRLPQQGTFFTVDADLVGITDAIPWSLNEQWLDALARSGAVTMVSPGPPARGPEQRQAVRAAFQVAAAGGLGARPGDWIESSTPQQWQAKDGATKHYDWTGDQGASPFLSP